MSDARRCGAAWTRLGSLRLDGLYAAFSVQGARKAAEVVEQAPRASRRTNSFMVGRIGWQATNEIANQSVNNDAAGAPDRDKLQIYEWR